MGTTSFSNYSDIPEEYRIFKGEWKKIEAVLAAKDKFVSGPMVKLVRDSKGRLVEGEHEDIGAYSIMQASERVGLEEKEEVIVLRTHDPEVKQILEDLRISSKDQGLRHPLNPFPRLRSNAIKPLGEIGHYQEYESTLVAPMRMKLVKKAFDYYNQHYAEGNRFRKMDMQLSELLEKRDYTLQEIKRDGGIHTLIIPSDDPERRAEFDKAMNSGEIPLGRNVYVLLSPSYRQKQEAPEEKATH